MKDFRHSGKAAAPRSATTQAMTPKLTFHKGMDYAVVMLPNQTTDDPLARLYGPDRRVTKFGQQFAASSDMLETLRKTLAYLKREDDCDDMAEIMHAIEDVISQATEG